MAEPRRVVIAGYVRSPFTPAAKGDLKDVRADDLVAQTVKGLIDKTGVDPKLIEDLKLGCAFPEGEQGYNMARNVVFLAGLPHEIAGVTTNRFCGSSMQTIHDAVGMISTGMADAVICAGVESMSHMPMGGFNPMINPDLYNRYPEAFAGMGETAENVSDRFKVTREMQEEFAVLSQQKTAKAQKEDAFREEIIAITTPSGKKVTEDGCPRPDTTIDNVKKLKPVFKAAGSVTAATSSPLTDGASAVLVVSEDFAKEHGLTILARIKSFAISGCDPEIMGMGPVESMNKAMAKAGITAEDIDILEINEAFAVQAKACIDQLGIPVEKVNKDGGAIAIGHPLGASGARITGKAAQLLHKEGARYAASTMCIGGGQGIATILENPANDNNPAPPKAVLKPKVTCCIPPKG